MEVDHCGCFIALACANGRDTVIKRSKVQVIVQLESQLVELHLVDLCNRCDDAHLEGDSVAKGVAMRSTEAQVNFMFLVITDGMVVCLDWHTKLELLLSSNVLSDRHVHHLDRESGGLSVTLASVIHAEEAALLPRPVGSVLNADLWEECLTRSDLEHVIGGLCPADGALAFPLAHLLAPLLEAFAPSLCGTFRHVETCLLAVLLEIFWLHVLRLHESF